MRLRRLLAACCLLVAATLAAAEEVVVNFVGDVMLDDGPGRVIRRGRDPFAPFASLLDAADLRVGNLECVVARGGKAVPGKTFTFRAHPRTLKPLRRHFDVVGLANNHSGDYGADAFGEMLDRLEQAGIGYFGGGRDLRAAHAPHIVEKHGVRIALLGYNEFFPRSFEADTDRAGIAWSEDEQVRLDIEAARQQADIVIPVMHWGWEFEHKGGPRQRQLARLMIDAGADAVVGGHPHVTQDHEVYRGRPIIYSLGNFLFDSWEDEDTTTGWLLAMRLDRSGVVGWRTHIARIDKDGVPHPAPGGECWQRTQAEAVPCPAKP